MPFCCETFLADPSDYELLVACVLLENGHLPVAVVPDVLFAAETNFYRQLDVDE